MAAANGPDTGSTFFLWANFQSGTFEGQPGRKNLEILAWVRADCHEGVLAKVPFFRLPLNNT